MERAINAWRLQGQEHSKAFVQYERLVRRFLKSRPNPDDWVTADELIRYLVSLESPDVSRVSVSALSSFFDYLAHAGNAPPGNPSFDLARKMKVAKKDQDLVRALVSLGIASDEISWRNLANAIFSTRTNDRASGPEVFGRESAAWVTAVERLLEILKNATADDLDKRLDRPILEWL